MDPGDPLATYVIRESVPINASTYLSQFYLPDNQTGRGREERREREGNLHLPRSKKKKKKKKKKKEGIAYAVIHFDNILGISPPYMVAYSQETGWSEPSFPTGISSGDFCPLFSCAISM